MTNSLESKEKLNPAQFNLDNLDLQHLYSIVWQRKRLLALITFIFSILASIVSFSLPNIYESNAILSPSGEESSLSSQMGNYSGLASLAGIELPGQQKGSVTVEAIEKLKTLSFFTESILPNIYLPDLMATKSWDSKSQKSKYDLNSFNKNIPSAQESFEEFEEIIKVTEDIDTGFVKISISHQSPIVAKEWIELIVKELNYFFRTKDKQKAQAAVNFLNIQFAQTNFAEVKQAIAAIIQQKTQQLTLIEASDYYIFDYIDPPVVAEKKSRPNRFLIFILGLVLGFISGTIFILFRWNLKNITSE